MGRGIMYNNNNNNNNNNNTTTIIIIFSKKAKNSRMWADRLGVWREAVWQHLTPSMT